MDLHVFTMCLFISEGTFPDALPNHIPLLFIWQLELQGRLAICSLFFEHTVFWDKHEVLLIST